MTPEIQIRDPFLIVDAGRYWLFGSTDRDIWRGPGTGFDCWSSEDLVTWMGPVPAWRPPDGFWGTTQYWAPEVHRYADAFYLFATFGASVECAGTVDGSRVVRRSQVFRAETVAGPYLPWSDGPITPDGWQCLDATLHIDADGRPWTVFCHEWQQVHDGGIWAQRLTDDLRRPTGRPQFCFTASEAPWVRPLALPPQKRRALPCFVTDGPFAHRCADGTLLMLWSSHTDAGYAMGVSRSLSGLITGPWVHQPSPLVDAGCGHGMVVRGLDGRLLVTYHEPNTTPDERLVVRHVVEEAGTLRLVP